MAEGDLTFHHLGLAVHEPADALNFLMGMGYQCGEVIKDSLQNVNLIMCTHAHAPAVEIVFSTGSPGPLDSILRKTREHIYHLCYSVQNVDVALQVLEARGLRVLCVNPAKEAILFGNQKVSFYYIEGFGLVEMLESVK